MKKLKYAFYTPEANGWNHVRIWSNKSREFNVVSDYPLTRKNILLLQELIGYDPVIYRPHRDIQYRQRTRLGKNYLKWSAYDN